MQSLLALLLGALSYVGPKSSYEVTQPPELSGPLHDPVNITFTFSFLWKLKQKSNTRISRTQEQLFEQVIYNSSFAHHPLFWGQLSLTWTSEEQNGFLLIQDLRKEDECQYYCTFWVSTKHHGVKNVSSFCGTKVKITEVPKFFSDSQANLAVILYLCLIHKIGVCVIMEILVLPKVLD
uniref:paired immunoglobulin-like type 2 receptor beta n=1 Tax=Phascolarctos cinereus TaxID=38626 RepID=UPI000A284EA4|nr:paired immunoglobulin-like type 2 receptor beta [Phascolarctos cinereus]